EDANASDQFISTVFRYASVAVSVSTLEALQVSDSEFAYHTAAFDVAGTTGGNPVLGTLPCVPPYLSVVEVSNSWFGTSGWPGASIDLAAFAGVLVPDQFGSLYGSLTSMISAEASVSDNTVPWSIYSCPEAGIPPVPVTAVDIQNLPLAPPFPQFAQQ